MANDLHFSDYADERFAALNMKLFDEYIEYRLDGADRIESFARIFGHDDKIRLNVMFIEHNPYYRKEFERRLEARKPQEMWNEKKAIQALLSMSQDNNNKCSTKLAAIKELNILVGVTVVDESGKTKRGRTLEDFYSSVE